MKLITNKKSKKNKNGLIMINNFVDEDVQAMLRPLNLMQTLILCPKYDIKNNFIHKNSRLTNLITFIGTFSIIIAYGYRLCQFRSNEIIRQHMNILYMVSFFDIFFYCLGFSLNCFFCIVLVKNNIRFLLIFQDIHRFINSKKHFKTSVIVHWACVIYIFGVYICLPGIVLNIFMHLPLHTVITSMSLVCFDANIIYGIMMMRLLVIKVGLFDNKMLSSRLRDDVGDRNYCKAMLKAYSNILDCYKIFKLNTEYLILYYTIELFLHTLIDIQILIDLLKLWTVGDTIVISVTMVSVYLWMIKTFILVTVFSVYCEKFYIGLSNIQESCAFVLSSHRTNNEQRLSKDIRRLHRASFKKMSACGLFYIDAGLPLSLLLLLTNYVVVLLQFAFL